MRVTESVTTDARRAQIADAATTAIHELGYQGASFARVAEYAGLSSTRLISYHFADKRDLTMVVLTTAMGTVDAVMAELIDGVTDRRELLRAYIRSQVALIGTHTRELRAIAEIGTHARDADGTAAFEPVLRDYRVGRLHRQLAQGLREGVFAGIDPAIMATTIRHAIDGAWEHRLMYPDTDPAVYGDELATAFDRAVTAAAEA